MSQSTTTLDGQILTVKSGEFTLAFNLYDTLAAADDDTRLAIAGAVGWGPVLRQAAVRLADHWQSDDWSDGDWQDRAAFLAGIKDELSSKIAALLVKESDLDWLVSQLAASNEVGSDGWALTHRADARAAVAHYLRHGKRPEPGATK